MGTSQDAAKVVSSLEEKLADVRRWKNEIEASIKETAFAAHVDGGDARSKLDNLNEQAVAAGREIASLETAIVEARARLASAQAAELDAEQRSKASRALALLDAFAARGRALDKAFEKVLSEYADLERDFHQLEALGFPPTSFALVSANMSRAVSTKLMFTPLRQEFLPPHERRTFGAVISGWAANVRARAEARLAKGNKDRDAA